VTTASHDAIPTFATAATEDRNRRARRVVRSLRVRLGALERAVKRQNMLLAAMLALGLLDRFVPPELRKQLLAVLMGGH